MKLPFLSAIVAACALSASAAFSLDLELSPYKRLPSLSGKLKSVGSDTMLHEMELWADGFKTIYPGVQIEIDGKGSNTAPPALLSGEAQLGPMSRQMTVDEIDAFEAKFGYKPTAVLVAVDALAIYVHKDNPITCFAMEEVERIFSADPKNGDGKSIHTWGELGLTGEWARKPITMYSRNSLSGTHKLFKQQALGGADFKTTVHMEPGSEAVVSAVSADAAAIGYSGIGYKTSGVRAVPVAQSQGKKCYDTSFESAYTRKYPLARGLYVYLMKDPKAPMDTLSGEFVKYILSKDGQTQAKRGGYYPITRNIREHELTRLGLLVSAE
ncbi:MULTISPECIES: phosphate ABC transporter substrate-binding protein [Methylocystis]|uniref:Phosphate-binding protein PstS n=1 Tax=Methylocystis iwaonis TaxID=2885079 RepID=A0ABN6VIN7_9HYPH|nr:MULTISPECIES: phosphate ABC transporter substrate-binding protein [Methylocystis]MDJ0447816.1 phosphate ABC transporter substrate-binding protein [Methylocystis sp. JR02]BDV34625.1 phosphate-binding protein PstS [Methylocystis iwaonis]